MLHVRDDATSVRRGRLFGIAAAIVVHLLIAAFILSGMPKSGPAFQGAHELILALMPKPKPVETRPGPNPEPRRAAQPDREPHGALVTGPWTEPSNQEGFRVPLFRCAPENLGKLPPEEQAKCGDLGFSPPDDDTLLALRSHVRQPALRAAELAARKAPVRVDCTHLESHVIQNMVRENSLFVDPLCAAGKIWRAAGR